MRTNSFFSAALILISFFFINNSANAQMIVSDSTEKAGIRLVDQQDGDPILIVYNIGQMSLEQLEDASMQIEDDIQQTETMIRVLGKCNECNQDLDLQVKRNENNEKILIKVDLQIQKMMDQNQTKIAKNK